LRAVEKWRVGGKGVRESTGRVEWIKVKHIHSGHTLRHPFNINLNINERQDCKRGIVCMGVLVGGERVNEGA
jgi:hypothetical protein